MSFGRFAGGGSTNILFMLFVRSLSLIPCLCRTHKSVLKLSGDEVRRSCVWSLLDLFGGGVEFCTAPMVRFNLHPFPVA